MIVIDTKMARMPEHCGKCAMLCQLRGEGRAWCGANGLDLMTPRATHAGLYERRPAWCPLKEVGGGKQVAVYSMGQLTAIARLNRMENGQIDVSVEKAIAP